MNETIGTIMNRRSVRAFAPAPVARETLERIVRAGMAAPTAVDARPWEFVVVTERALLRQLADALPYAKMTASAAAAIVIAGDLDRQHGGRDADYWLVDCAAATENVLLAAASLGLGAVWTAVHPDAARIAAVRALLALPAAVVPLSLVPLGVPAGDAPPKDKWDETRLHWNGW